MTKISFTGTLGVEDMARHIPLHFDVSEGTKTLRISFEHDPEHPGVGPLPHQLSISVYGPNGARGTRHCNEDQSPIISKDWSSPGYTPDAIEPGAWVIEIDTHRILPPGNIKYSLTVEMHETETTGATFPAAKATDPRGPGWYRGDLHGHSDHSDASWPVADFIAHARNRNLDFVTLTDHNSVSGLPEAQSLAGDDLLVMGGVELTTFHGHCLALGTITWVDWRIKDGQTMAARAQDLMDHGLTYIIAHPMALGHPWCTGCHWAYGDVFPGPARMVEIWNSAWGESKNELGLQLFQTWLNTGLRMAATAGTDIHGPTSEDERVGYNTVWAEALSQDAILAGLRAGRNVMSAGPGLLAHVLSETTETHVGDLAPSNENATLHVSWSDVPDGAIATIETGSPDGTKTVATQKVVSWDGGTKTALPTMPETSWIMVTLRCSEGQMLAVTNPIFFPGDWR